MTPAGVLAAACTAICVLLVVRGRVRVPGLWPRSGRRLEAGPGMVAVLAVAVVALLGSVLTGRRLVLALIAVAVVLAVLRLVGRSRRTARAERRAAGVLAACDAMAAELTAGQPAVAALERAADDWPGLRPAVSAAHLGADVPGALRALATDPGAGELRILAAAWQVAHESGCGLADAVATAAGTIRAHRTTRRLVGTELAAARATARLMALLPFAVLLLGAGVGGDPVGFLTGTPAGLGCLAAGLALSYAGVCWLDAIADRVLHR